MVENEFAKFYSESNGKNIFNVYRKVDVSDRTVYSVVF